MTSTKPSGQPRWVCGDLSMCMDHKTYFFLMRQLCVNGGMAKFQIKFGLRDRRKFSKALQTLEESCKQITNGF